MPARDPSAFLPQTIRLVPVEIPADTSVRSAGVPFTWADVPRLCAGLRAGEHGAFRFLHEEWNGRILRYCLALAVGNESAALEIVQATYLRIFKQVRALPDETALWHWLARAARCAAADLHRVGGRYRRALARFAEFLRIRRGAGTEGVGESSLMVALDRALDALHEDERQLIEARYFQRASLEKIAQATGATVRAVEGRLARVRERLRQAIAKALRHETL